MSHTATPWHMNNRRIEVANRPQVIADVRTQTDAEFIVRACNSHAALVEALKAMLEAYAPKADWSKPEKLHSAVLKAGEAIAQAEGC